MTTPICSNCIYYNGDGFRDRNWCTRKHKQSVDIVDGDYDGPISLCRTERSAIMSLFGSCGPSGKYYEEKKQYVIKRPVVAP